MCSNMISQNYTASSFRTHHRKVDVEVLDYVKALDYVEVLEYVEVLDYVEAQGRCRGRLEVRDYGPRTCSISSSPLY